jgi:hypothetical protein
MSKDKISYEQLVNTREAISRLGGSQKLFRRSLACGWLRPSYCGTHGTPNLFRSVALDNLILRIDRGDRPPLLPSELSQKQRSKGGLTKG